MRAGSRRLRRALRTPAASRPCASAFRPSTNSVMSRASTTARCGWAARPTAMVKQASASCASGRPCSARAQRPASSASATGSRADSTKGHWRAPARSAGGASGVGGASATTTCALVPLKPNELTPAMRWPLMGSQGVSAVGTRSAKSPQGMCGLGDLKCRCAGICFCCSASTSLMRPVMPAAASRWPMLVLTEPSQSACSRSEPNTFPSACTSSGSPSCVPVPCASM